MTTLAEFLAARYDEAEALARAADPGPWTARNLGRHDLSAVIIRKTGETPVARVPTGPALVQFEGSHAAANSLYVAANDPAHRLADIKLKRAILAEHHHYDENEHLPGLIAFGCGTCDRDSVIMFEFGVHWCATVRQLGTEFDQHPDYRPEWAPEGAPDGT